jgi:Vacuolar protein sorting protein 36 Vps36
MWEDNKIYKVLCLVSPQKDMEAYFEEIDLMDLIPGEMLLLDLLQTGIYLQNDKTAFQNGSFKLTQNSIYWQDLEIIWKLRLSQIHSAEAFQGFLTASPKLILTCRQRPKDYEWSCDICNQINANTPKCSNCGVFTSRTRPCQSCTFLNLPDLINCEICNEPLNLGQDNLTVIKISFRGSNQPINHILTVLKQTLDQKLWISIPSPTKPGLGVSSILKNIQNNSNARKELISLDSFQDLESLMEKAGEMVRVSCIYLDSSCTSVDC